jgi:TPR repeat protein
MFSTDRKKGPGGRAAGTVLHICFFIALIRHLGYRSGHMTTRVLFSILLFAAAVTGQEEVRKRITAGDPLSEVYRSHGKPVLEYPLDGTMVQEYAACTIVSSNGIVLSANYKKAEPPERAAAGNPAAPTIEETKELAMAGDAEAQYVLAYCFQFGNHVEQDTAKAVNWYIRSALQGHMRAQHNLGYLYMNGRGVEKDLKQAYAWGLLSAENGNDTVIRALKYKLSDEQKQLAEVAAEHLRLQIQAQQAAP